MAVWLKQAVLVLLTVAEAAMVGNSDEILLRESGGHGSPKERWNISARSLTFKCLIHADSVRYRVTFFFNDTKNNSLSCQTGTCGNLETSTTKQEQKNQTQPYMKCNCTTWEIHNVTSANNGFYSCETVTEIPDLRTNKSTQVEVFIEGSSVESTTLSRRTETKVPLENSPSSSMWPWLLVGVSSLIVVILMVLCVIFRRACLRNRDELDPVYANTHPKKKERSPRPPPRPDQLKLAEPYQNLRTPSPSRRYEEGKRRLRP
ncbi:uncharacterized protein LOC105353998 isoform X1 [Oryzias latipes]|uniref:uncharacterized protein LOC105353998 isoform X1 n=1 Tax=Oryzias latipes TaxID=8090 RepID=UPI0005CC2535|nr:uncharacterized protein LOC105353998 isoform X1 [Oryzias latipes]